MLKEKLKWTAERTTRKWES